MNDFAAYLVLAAVVFLAAGFYVAIVWNDFHRRWQTLWRLLADVHIIQARRRGVGGSVDHHIRHATRHEQQIATRGACRNKRHALIGVSDNFNGWPSAAAVQTVDQGLAVDVNSRDQENQAQLQLNAAAGEYNALLDSFPRGWVGRRLGFRRWRLRTSSLRPTRRRGRSHRCGGLKRTFRRRRSHS